MDLTMLLAYTAIMDGKRQCDNCNHCKPYSDDTNHFYCKLDGMQVLDNQFCEDWKARKKKA